MAAKTILIAFMKLHLENIPSTVRTNKCHLIVQIKAIHKTQNEFAIKYQKYIKKNIKKKKSTF